MNIFLKAADQVLLYELSRSAFLAAGVICGIILFKRVIVSRFAAYSTRTTHKWDDAVSAALDHFGVLFALSLSVLLSLNVLPIPDAAGTIIRGGFLTIIAYSLTRAAETLLMRAVDMFVHRYSENRALDHTIIHFLQISLRAALWIGAALLLLDNFGVKITAILGGIGVLGIAGAFALQSILQDIFAFFTIYFDKPVKKGDIVALGADRGEVRKIGLKSTRIRTQQGEELIISNRDLTNVRVNNFRTMKKRQVIIRFGIVYETPLPKLKALPGMVEKIVSSVPETEFERLHLIALGESGLEYELTVYILSSDRLIYRDSLHTIHMSIIDVFEKEHIAFAYPTRTVYQPNLRTS